MKSLHARLDDQKDQVLRVVEAFGVFRAMDQFAVSSYDRFRIWLQETTGDGDYGLRPKISPRSGETLGDQLVAAFLLKVAALEADNTRLKQQVDGLRWQLERGKGPELDQALAVLEACEV